MDGDRKYKQAGYQDSSSEKTNGGGSKADHYINGEYYGPRAPLDGPRTPRLVRSVAASRCFNCSNALPAGFDFLEPCPKCATLLHCCSQCGHMDSSARFQCLQTIPERIPYKDKSNECKLFSPRITVARDTAAPVTAPNAKPSPVTAAPNVPRKVQDARNAFDNLFKKTPE